MAMGRAPIPRQIAKQELERINEYVKEPLLLIGGLAVQQYTIGRNSSDIDLVCDSELVYRIARDLYPDHDWLNADEGEEYRPKITFAHRTQPIKVHFGPKVIERGEYPYLSWSDLSRDSSPFRISDKLVLDRIRVPAAHDLAYTKLVSFLGRYDEREKALQDLHDFCSLLAHASFSLQGLYDRMGLSGSRDVIQGRLEQVLAEDAEAVAILNRTCLYYFVKIWPDSESAAKASTFETPAVVAVYYAAPHRNVEQNAGVAAYLDGQGISVAVPFDEVQQATGTATPSDGGRVREICIAAIDRCDGLVVDVDVYGLDTAWEIGYAEGLGKFVIGLNHDASLRNISRPVNRRLYSENFMHGWESQPIFQELEEACAYVQGRSVYLCGSFSNEYIKGAEEHLRGSAKHVIFPRDYVPENLPRDYPLRTRENAIHQLETCDVVLVALPRYGMDSSWQIGFATAAGKDIVGLMLPDDKGSGDSKTLWDHWMHGWHDKDVFTGRGKLAAALMAFATEDLIKRVATSTA